MVATTSCQDTSENSCPHAFYQQLKIGKQIRPGKMNTYRLTKNIKKSIWMANSKKYCQKLHLNPRRRNPLRRSTIIPIIPR